MITNDASKLSLIRVSRPYELGATTLGRDLAQLAVEVTHHNQAVASGHNLELSVQSVPPCGSAAFGCGRHGQHVDNPKLCRGVGVEQRCKSVQGDHDEWLSMQCHQLCKGAYREHQQYPTGAISAISAPRAHEVPLVILPLSLQTNAFL